jgi:hypothetical protein
MLILFHSDLRGLQPVTDVALPVAFCLPQNKPSSGMMTNQPVPQPCTADTPHVPQNNMLLFQTAFVQVHAHSVVQIQQWTRALLFDD